MTMASAQLTGTCLCGRVGYAVDDAFEYAMNCHCSRCRRSTGSAFKPLAGIAAPRRRLINGDRNVLLHGD